MKNWLIVFLFIVQTSTTVFSISKADSALIALDKAIENKDLYQLKKDITLSVFRKALIQTKENTQNQYTIATKLFLQYQRYQYDSAFRYAQLMLKNAYALHNSNNIDESKLKMAYCQISSGMFKEAIDTLKTIQIKQLSPINKVEYYSNMSRLYSDLAEYCNDSYYKPIYDSIGLHYCKLAEEININNSFYLSINRGIFYFKNGQIDNAQNIFEQLAKNKLTNNEPAVVYSCLGCLYDNKNRLDDAIYYLALSAINDLKNATKETTALKSLANILFKKGDVQNAYRYILISMDEAVFYGARQRKIQISSIMPIIQVDKLSSTEKQKQTLTLYLWIISAISLVAISLAIIVWRQLHTLKNTRKQILTFNAELNIINEELREANKIKEDYIGFYFTISSLYIDKLEGLKKSINQLITTKKTDEAKNLVLNIDIKKERELLFANFDRTFLKLFPNFIQHYNLLFKSDDSVVIKDEQTLNTELRIFALIRMGISDNEKIAKMLGLSVNTIYTYKTRIKNRAIVSNDEFERRIMSIRPI